MYQVDKWESPLPLRDSVIPTFAIPASAPQDLTLSYQGSLSFPFFKTGGHPLLTFGYAEWLRHCKVNTQLITL